MLNVLFTDAAYAAADDADDDDDDNDADAGDAVECNCNERGTTDQVCDEDSGRCLCEDSFTGPTCDRCAAGFYRFPQCLRMYATHTTLHMSHTSHVTVGGLVFC